MFDKENASYSADNYVKNNNGEEIYNAGSGWTTSFIKVKPNTNYNISGKITTNDLGGRIYFYDINKSWLSRSNSFSGINVDFTFSTPADCNYIQFSYVISAFDSNTVQLEEGSTATPYTPHKEQVLPLTLGNIELCKIGDYQDYFYKESNKWYLHKEIGKEVLNGTQNIAKNDSDSSNYLYYMNLGTRKIGGTVLSNKLTYKTLGQINGGNDVDTVGISTLSTSRLFYFNLGYYLTVNTVAGVNSYLTGNNITVYYQLEEPVNTEITDTTLISQLEAINNAISYEEQTNISGSSSGSNPIFNVEGYQNTKLVLQDISNAIVALGGV